MTKHRGLPWRVISYQDSNLSPITHDIRGVNNDLIAEYVSLNDAAFIVKAVNNHDSLVAALEHYAKVCDMGCEDGKIAIAALAKARGK